MIFLQSAIICDEVQELLDGGLNYIGIFNEIAGIGPLDFDFVCSWFGEKGNYTEKISLVSPNGDIISQVENEFTLENAFHTSITSFEVDLNFLGTYIIEVKINDSTISNVPLIVYSEKEK